VCSFEHFKEFSYENSAIRLRKNEEFGTTKIIVCRHCKVPECAKDCPPGALSKNKDSGLVSLDPEKCTKCMLCIEACPYNSIFTNKVGTMIMCDMCDGDPMCARYCPAEAIEWIKKYKMGERRQIVHVINREME